MGLLGSLSGRICVLGASEALFSVGGGGNGMCSVERKGFGVRFRSMAGAVTFTIRG